VNQLAGRSATPEDVARAILALTTNTYVTGEIMVLDDGLTLVM
jgi:NAD(P)-dependent dehydrogenase (short-subunit alcohol dehydrogenase family)